DLDRDVGDLRLYFLRVLQPIAVLGRRMSEQPDREPFGLADVRALERPQRDGRLFRQRAPRGVRREELGRLLQQARRDDQAVDLVGAFVNPRDARVAVRALDRKFTRVPVAAEYLDRLV